VYARRYSVRKPEDEPAAPTGAAKPYRPPPKPEPRAPTVPKGVAAARSAPKGSATDRSHARGEMADPGVQQLLQEKDVQIAELSEHVDILEVKIHKLEQLVRLKDSKIATLQAKLQQADGR
jgi:hypothetical protein